MAASRFKDTRLMCCLSVPDAGKLFRVSERTIRNWEAGRVGIPYAAFKLMRILRGYELPGQAWKGFRLKGDTLWSPEGKGFKASDHTWWSLTVGMAQEFRTIMAARRSKAGQRVGVADGGPTLGADDMTGRNGPCSTGLVYSSTSENGISEKAENKGSAITGRAELVGPVVVQVAQPPVRQLEVAA